MSTLVLLLVLNQPVLDSAFDRMHRSTRVYVLKVAEAFDPTRSLRVQLHLLDEDLIWQTRGLSERQRTIVSVIALYKAMESIEGIIEEPDEEQKKQLSSIIEFEMMAQEHIKEIVAQLGTIHDHELKFYF